MRLAFPPHDIYIGHNDRGYGVTSRPLDRTATTPYDYRDRYLDYAKNVLRDPRGDDGPKREEEVRTNYNLSQQRINMATFGSKSELSPLLYDSDWTFDDMQRDPRGWTNQPRYEEMRKINDRRFNLLPMADDLDKMPEGFMDPLLLNHSIKIWDRYLQATRFTNFGSTEENMLKAVYNLQSHRQPGNNTAWEIVKSIETNPLFKRSNIVLSNDITLGGHLSVPDHKVEPQKVGVLYGMAPFLDHQSAMRTYANENVYKDSQMMEKMIKRLRSLSAARSALETVITENAKDTGLEYDPKGTRLTSELLSLMGFTEHDIKEGRQDEVSASNPGRLQAHRDMKMFVEKLQSMPDSEKEFACSKIVGELSHALGDVRRAVSNVVRGHKASEVREALSNKMPGTEVSNLNKTLIELNRDVREALSNKMPTSMQGLRSPQQHLVTRDTSKAIKSYKMPGLRSHSRLDDKYNHEMTDAGIQVSKSLQKMVDDPGSLARSCLSPTEYGEMQPTIEHLQDRRELPNINLFAKRSYILEDV